MTLHLKKIISGGQTGADTGGLLTARELEMESGGTAPKGWLTENGAEEERLRSFGLVECEEEGYPARTRRNVEDSDGTLLVGPYRTGGSRLTHEIAQELEKPLFLVELGALRIEEFRMWLEHHRIRILNVAGRRESESPGIEEFTRSFLVNALRVDT